MFSKIKNLVMIALIGSTFLAPALTLVLAGTVSADINSSLCQGVNNAAEGTNTSECGSAGEGETNLSGIASEIVNIFSIVVGIVAVIMIIYGGFRYITSGGDTGKVGNAKNSLIYAVIGLIIVALAQIIVNYVLNTATDAASNNNLT